MNAPPKKDRASARSAASYETTAQSIGDRLPFGKHRGKRLRDVPEHYLSWLRFNVPDLDANLKAAVEDELLRRIAPEDSMR